MITPTVGRIVYFHPGGGARSRIIVRDNQPLRADILYVHDDQYVALNVDDHEGNRHFMPKVFLLQDDVKPVEGLSYCEWMPYQKGQAAKAEALEKAALK